jgi:hypothetical protein
VLRRIFRSQGNKITGGWRKLHNEELHNLYSLSNIVSVIKLRSLRWAGHIVCMGNIYIKHFAWKNIKEETVWETNDVREITVKAWTELK